MKIHASTVSALTSSEPLVSAIETAVLKPLNATAEPVLPAAQDGLLMAAVLLFPDASLVVAPDPSLKA